MFAGKVWVRQLEQRALIEQPHLDRAVGKQPCDPFRAQRGNPVETLRPQLVNARLRNHAAVAHDRELGDAELLPHPLEGGQQRFRIAGAAFKHRHGHGHARPVGQQAVVDLELALLAVAVVSETGQGAGLKNVQFLRLAVEAYEREQGGPVI